MDSKAASDIQPTLSANTKLAAKARADLEGVAAEEQEAVTVAV